MRPTAVRPEAPRSDGLQDVVPEHVLAIVGDLAAAFAQMVAKELARSTANGGRGGGTSNITGDAWMTVEEAATRYHVSVSWLYRNSKRLGFGKKLGAKLLISVCRLEEYLDRGLR